MALARAVAASALLCAGSLLEGCGGGGSTTPGPSPSPSPSPSPGPSPTPTPTPEPGPPTTTTPAPAWNSNPIEVRGSHMYDAVTGESFFARGIAFPDLAEDATIDDYIATIVRLKGLSSNFNMIRMYKYPGCIWQDEQGWCMQPFFEQADKLGIYVLLAATGKLSGFLPSSGFTNAQDCYQKGDVLTLGKQIIQKFNYPNALAIVIGNEFLGITDFSVISVLKAYARDLKAYMDMCHNDVESPSHGAFRKIPILYASNDDSGDALDMQKAAYLFCDSAEVSIDIFGLNIERWCTPSTNSSYDSVQNWVSEANHPGAFIFSEMGCPQNIYPGGVRKWHQIYDFFATHSAFDGFAGYSYWSDNSFVMFEAATPNAAELPDGENFFAALDAVGAMAKREPGSPTYAGCQAQFPSATLGPYTPQTIEPYTGITDYNQVNFTANSCPHPRVPSGGIAASKTVVV